MQHSYLLLAADEVDPVEYFILPSGATIGGLYSRQRELQSLPQCIPPPGLSSRPTKLQSICYEYILHPAY